jgi:hypothetical protein
MKIVLKHRTVAEAERIPLPKRGPSCVVAQCWGEKAIKAREVEILVDDGQCTIAPADECPSFLEGECDGEGGEDCKGWATTYPVCAECEKWHSYSEIICAVLNQVAENRELFLPYVDEGHEVVVNIEVRPREGVAA